MIALITSAGIHPMNEKSRDDCRTQHHVEQNIVELHQQTQQRTSAFWRCQSVRPMLGQATAGFIAPKADRPRLQAQLDILFGEGVPGHWLR